MRNSLSKKGAIVIAIYSHPEYYPPTLNAIDLLASEYETIFVLHRNITGFDWVYPENVKLVGPSKLRPVRDVEKASTLRKIFWFLNFSRLLFTLIRRQKPDTILLYDCIPVLAYRITRFLFKRPKVLWYHNHDVSDPNYLRKFSIGWFAWKSEQWIMPKLQIFSLPSLERQTYFATEKLNGVFIFIPNYPSLRRYQNWEEKNSLEFRILYQGSIGPMHGLEQLIPLLKNKYQGMPIKLILKGFVSDFYLNELRSLAAIHEVNAQLEYLPPSGYDEVIQNANKCHIGVGIFMKQDIMNRTLGTSSNKIYEYAASGMPVLMYNIEHFRKALDGHAWVFFTDSSTNDLDKCLNDITSNYSKLSQIARDDFEKKYSFEMNFREVISFLTANR